MSTGLIIALLAALSGGSVAAAVAGYFARPRTIAEARKLDVEADQTLDKRWQAWASKLEGEVDELRKKVAVLETTVTEEREENQKTSWLLQMFLEWALAMRERLDHHGLEPVPPPPGVRIHLAKLREDY